VKYGDVDGAGVMFDLVVVNGPEVVAGPVVVN
jgi:hypothetical protein